MTPLPDMPDMGEGLANLASLASIATDMQQTARKWGAAALTLHSVGHEARAEARAVVAGCSIACSAIARTLAADYDTDDPDGTDADELALLVLTIRATRRAALHIQTLAEEATP